jgi:hypothetical protein
MWPVLLVAVAALLYRGRIQHEMVDFQVYRTAATRALSGEELYRPSDGHYQFKYLPAFALAMAPLAVVDNEAAKAIWFALSAGLLTAFIRWSVRALPERRRSDRVLVIFTVVLMAKFYAHGSLLVASLLAVQIDKPHIAGVLMGLAAFVKPYALLMLPWLAFTYGVGSALMGVGVLALGLIFPAVAYGWTGNLDLLAGWYRTVTGSTESNLLGADNVSLAAMWAKWIGVGAPAAALATITTGAALGLVATVWVRRSQISSPEYLEFSLLMLLVPLLSPQGWDYVLLLGTPAVICLVDRWSEMGREWRLATAVALALMGLTIFDVMGRELYGRFMALSVVSAAAICAAVSLAYLRWKTLG